MKSFTQIGSYMSVAQHCNLGSSISLRSFARMGSGLSIVGVCRLENWSFVGDGSNELAIKYNNVDQFSFSGSPVGGTFGGSAEIEGTTISSDRRLKTDIVPLYRSMMDSRRDLDLFSMKEMEQLADKELQSLAVLRKLRPVSYKYKQAAESKHSRFGFIAQEIETALPNIVEVDPSDGMKSLRMMDLISVLTMVIQSLDTISEEMLLAPIRRLEARIDSDYELFEPKVAALEKDLLENIMKDMVLPRLVMLNKNEDARNATALDDSEVWSATLQNLLDDDLATNTTSALAEMEAVLSKLDPEVLEELADTFFPDSEDGQDVMEL
jgi:hypothetical protein